MRFLLFAIDFTMYLWHNGLAT